MARSRYDSEQVTVTSVPFAQPRPGERRACLIVLSGANVGRVFSLSEITIIGRDNAADVQLLDAGISRRHASILRQGAGYELRDLESRNGTFANGQRVAAQVALQDNDKIQVGGQTVLKFCFADEVETNYAEQMYEVALRDALTSTFNRRYFDERLVAEFSFAARHDKPLALLLIDLDHFKQVNDTHGHPLGDRLLVEIAALFGTAIRGEDVLTRYGGEEFAILCRNTDAMKASVLAERIRHSVAGHTFLPAEAPTQLTVSIGVVAMPAPGLEKPEDIVKAADDALYQAKTKGRNCVVTRRAV